MFELPETTRYNRKIPKQRFYDNLDINAALKRVFVEQIKGIFWKNKLAPSTVNIEAGVEVTEIQIFEIQLTSTSFDESVLTLIDKRIPYHIVFFLAYEDKYQIWIGYKELIKKGYNAFKVLAYYHTDWVTLDNIPLKLEGMDLDTVFFNFIRQVAGDELRPKDSEESLKDTIQRVQLRKSLEKEMLKMEKRARAINQPNKQLELVKQINSKRKQLEEL